MKVKFLGATEEQIRWGRNDDPNKVLIVGKTYEVIDKEVHSWHTKIRVSDYPDLQFNDASFEYI